MTESDSNERAKEAKRGSPFLSPEQAAFYLKISVRTLQEHRSFGTGPRYRRHCRRVLYHIDDLEAWSAGSGGEGDQHGN